MATLELAMPYLKENEGGWSYITGDSGGMTYIGISRKNHPEWAGWAIIDSLNLPVHDASACNQILDANPHICLFVNDFYSRNYWRYDGIQNQDVATKLFDGAVNMEGDGSHGAAIEALQRAINKQYPSVPMTPRYGPNTELMANKCDPDGLLNDLARQYMLHYNAILVAHPEDEKFRAGWMERAVKLPTDAQVFKS
jgi:lysozyme family protein